MERVRLDAVHNVLVRLENQDGLAGVSRPAEDVAAVGAREDETRAPPRGLLYHGPRNRKSKILLNDHGIKKDRSRPRVSVSLEDSEHRRLDDPPAPCQWISLLVFTSVAELSHVLRVDLELDDVAVLVLSFGGVLGARR